MLVGLWVWARPVRDGEGDEPAQGSAGGPQWAFGLTGQEAFKAPQVPTVLPSSEKVLQLLRVHQTSSTDLGTGGAGRPTPHVVMPGDAVGTDAAGEEQAEARRALKSPGTCVCWALGGCPTRLQEQTRKPPLPSGTPQTTAVRLVKEAACAVPSATPHPSRGEANNVHTVGGSSALKRKGPTDATACMNLEDIVQSEMSQA